MKHLYRFRNRKTSASVPAATAVRFLRIWSCLAATAAIAVLSLPLTGCQKQDDNIPVSQSGFYFDTFIKLSVYEPVDNDIFTDAFALCDFYEHKFSRTMEGSDIWNINHAGGAPVKVDEETITLVKEALSYAALSDGIIDPTIASAKELWDFTAELPSLPDQTALEEACLHVNYENIVLDEDNLTITLTDPYAMLDLGFIAKGYIADRLKEYFLSKGITSALINLGGNVLCVGPKQDGSPYRVGIQYPFSADNEIIAAISCTDSSVVTSGNYERYFQLNGTVYHHILDSRTGYPVQNGLLSVTILSPSSTQGDALSTLCYCYGLEDGMALVESLEQVEAIFITDDYELHYSSGAPRSLQ